MAMSIFSILPLKNMKSSHPFTVLIAFFFALSVLCFVGPETSFAASKKRHRSMNISADATPEDIIALGEKIGPKSIRFTLTHPFADTASVSNYLAWLFNRLDYLDTVLMPILQQYNIKVVLSLGTPPGGFIERNIAKPKMRIFGEKEFQDTFIALWDVLAARYAGNTSILAYHLVNEPAIGDSRTSGLLSWPQLQNTLVKRIRVLDKKHPIIVTAEYSSPNRIQKVSVPKKLGPYWYGLTMYYPTKFLRQGVEYAPYTTTYPSSKVNKRLTTRYLQQAINFGKRVGSPIWVSEFATTRFAPAGSAPRFLRDVITIFNTNKWHWTYHAWREASPWNVELPALEDTDPSQLTQRAVVLKRYMK